MSETTYLRRNQTGDIAQSLSVVAGEERRALDATDCSGIAGGYKREC